VKKIIALAGQAVGNKREKGGKNYFNNLIK
jgi:hypothetical protein